MKPLIFRLFRTLPVSQRLRFLCLIIMACETSGIKLQGPSLCIRTHGWKFLSKKVDRLLTKNPLSETNVEFGFFVSSFLGQLFCFRISPCWSQHKLGPCSFIPVGDSRHDALNRNYRFDCSQQFLIRLISRNLRIIFLNFPTFPIDTLPASQRLQFPIFNYYGMRKRD